MDAATILLSLIGIALFAVVGLVLIDLRKEAAAPAAQQIVTQPVIVRQSGWWPPGYGPYYSHLPLRPLVY